MDELIKWSLAILAIYLIFKWWNSPYDIPHDSNIIKYAKMKTYPLGDTSSRLMESVYRWTYGIIVTCYKAGHYEEGLNLVLAWVHTQNDVSGSIYLGCDQAVHRVAKALDKVYENPEEFQLTCNPDFDYHMLPMTMLFNDYLDCESLIKQIDELLGGK